MTIHEHTAHVTAEAGDTYASIHERYELSGTAEHLARANGHVAIEAESMVLIPKWMTELPDEPPVDPDEPPVEPDPDLPPPPTGARYTQAFGMYPNFHTDAPETNSDTWGKLNAFVEALGRWPDILMVSLAGDTTKAMTSPAWGQFTGPFAYLPRIADRVNVECLIPANPDGGDPRRARTAAGLAEIRAGLIEVAKGRDDAAHLRVAHHIADAGYPKAILRIGSEADSTGYSSEAIRGGNHVAYRQAITHLMDVYKSVSPDFEYCWTIMHGPWNEGVAQLGYPGDDVVDYCGMDIYYRSDTPPTVDVLATQMRAMLSHAVFAAEHGKQVCYPEWASTGHNDDTYFGFMTDWHHALGDRLAYANYFCSSADHGYGVYDPRTYPKIWATFVAEYHA